MLHWASFGHCPSLHKSLHCTSLDTSKQALIALVVHSSFMASQQISNSSFVHHELKQIKKYANHITSFL
jgi:hypothetical protein